VEQLKMNLRIFIINVITESVRISTSQHRTIHINIAQTQHFVGNAVTTAKYNLVTFLPKFLFEQFRRYANVFFLVIGLLQQIPDVSPTGRYVTLVPFTVILGLTAVKELIEDYQRHRDDNRVNNTTAEVFCIKTVLFSLSSDHPNNGHLENWIFLDWCHMIR
jgi:magnesium-transporting ATPase (P-type)